MKREKFTFTILIYGLLAPLLVTLFFIFVKGMHEGNIFPYIIILFIPGCLSLYIAAHLLYNFIRIRCKNNKNIWLNAFYLVVVSYVLFGLISTVANGIYEPYKAFQDIQSYLGMSLVMGGMGFIATFWLSIPVGYYSIKKTLSSNKKLNTDSGADAPPPVN